MASVEALDLGVTGNAIRTMLYQNINQAFSLSTIVPIVAGAAFVIGALVAGFDYIMTKEGLAYFRKRKKQWIAEKIKGLSRNRCT